MDNSQAVAYQSLVRVALLWIPLANNTSEKKNRNEVIFYQDLMLNLFNLCKKIHANKIERLFIQRIVVPHFHRMRT